MYRLSGSITWNELFHILLWHFLAGWQLNLRHYFSVFSTFFSFRPFAIQRCFKSTSHNSAQFIVCFWPECDMIQKKAVGFTQLPFHMLKSCVCVFFFHFSLSDAKRFFYGCFSLQYTNLPLQIDHSTDDNQTNQCTSSCSFLFFVRTQNAFFVLNSPIRCQPIIHSIFGQPPEGR